MINQSFLKNTNRVYSPTAETCFALFTGGNALTEAEKIALSIFIDSQVASGNWRWIYTMKMGRRLSSEAKCLIDLKGIRNGTGTGTWNIATGIQTNGTSNFIDWGFIESTDATIALNSIGYGSELVSNDHGTAAGELFGAIGTSAQRQTRYNQSVGGVNRVWKAHSGGTATTALGAFTSNKWHVITRTLSNRQNVFSENWDNPTLDTNLSQNIPDKTIYGGAINNNGTAQNFMAGKFGTFILFDAVQFDTSNFFVNWQFMMQMLGDTKGDLYPYDNVKQYYKTTDAIVLKLNGQSNGSGTGTSRNAKYAYPINSRVFWTTANPPVSGTPTVVQQLEFGKNHTFDTITNSGYELPMCYELAVRTNARVVLNKFTRAGSDVKGVTALPGAGTWKVSASELINLSENIISIRGLQIIDDTHTIKKMFIIWDQHEADVNGTDTSTYNTELSLIFKYMIDQHEASGYDFVNTTELHVIIRKAWTGLSGSTVSDIIAAQNGQESHFNSTHPTYASKIRSWKLFTSEDLYFQGDNVHLTALSYEIVGIRLGLWLSRH